MHLIVQIPCFNEANTLPAVLADIPRTLDGVDQIEVLVVDDGSSDDTAEIARQHGADYVVHHHRNLGLATAFQTGLDTCLRLGADVIVNTDGDHQYPGDAIDALVTMVVEGRADIVVGDRQPHQIGHFSPLKRGLQRWGSRVVRLASGTDVPDATSGFRAFSREAALRLIVLTRYTYTLETLIQAGKKGLVVAHTPIKVNAPQRQSRLVRSNWDFVKRSAATIVRLYALYEPLYTFSLIASPFLLVGVALLARFLFFYFLAQSGVGRYIQSITIGGTLLTVGFLIFLFGVVADINSTQRALLEEILYRQRKRELEEDQKNREE